METPTNELEIRLSDIVERKERVAEALQWLDGYLEKHGTQLPERLTHFLEKRSYHKALAYVREGDTGHKM